jgi:transcription antitermination protein NusB
VTAQDHREAALHALYEADQRREEFPPLDGLSKRSEAIVSGVWASREALDVAIGDASTGWRVERMPPVDRNVLRIALWELRSRPDVPVPVVIAEAVRLVKAYSTARSGAFVNGVLSKLASERDRE